MSGYTPVFDAVFDGTLCGKWPDLPVWLTLLPLADRFGRIDMTLKAISARTGWPLDYLAAGIAGLCQPDPDSRSQAEDGRRLVLIDPDRAWGWVVVNHERYREKARKAASESERIASGRNAERMAARRAAETREDPRSPAPTRDDRLSDSDSDSDSDSEKRSIKNRSARKASRTPVATRIPPDFDLTPERIGIAEAEGIPLPAREFARFVDYWKAASGSNARKHDWGATWRNWCRKAGDMKPKPKGAPVITWKPPPDEEVAA